MVKNLRDSYREIARKIAFGSVFLLRKMLFALYEYPQIKKQYGDFCLDKDYSEQHIKGLSKESGTIRGVIVNIVKNGEQNLNRVLLPGEYNTDKIHYCKLLNLDSEKIVTAGIGDDMDFEWDYEQDPPEMGKFDLIVSQAMLEHLIDPFKHVVDLSQMLNPGGKLILHTHVPGFAYHRYPIDCVRFFPDWFETVAERLDLSVSDRYIGDLRICYTLQKTNK